MNYTNKDSSTPLRKRRTEEARSAGAESRVKTDREVVMDQTNKQSSAVSRKSRTEEARSARAEPRVNIEFHGVRYQVKNVARSVEFYTQQLGFKLEHQQLPAFANVSLGNLRILLSGPEASGSRPMPDGRRQEPGGWNRVVLKVADLPGLINRLQRAGLHFRNEMETGPAGKQIQLEDPDGNAIELFEPRAQSAV
jgi:glyoxylase I family protein